VNRGVERPSDEAWAVRKKPHEESAFIREPAAANVGIIRKEFIDALALPHQPINPLLRNSSGWGRRLPSKFLLRRLHLRSKLFRLLASQDLSRMAE
jgi:hypothetical protein